MSSPSNTAPNGGGERSLRRTAQDEHGLIMSSQSMLRSIAWQIHQRLPKGIEIDDLIGDGNLGLAQAVKRWDPARGVAFSTFAYPRIRGAILDGLRKHSWFSMVGFDGYHYSSTSLDLVDQYACAAAATSLTDAVEDLAGTVVALGASEAMRARGAAGSPLSSLIQQETSETLRRIVELMPGDGGELLRRLYGPNSTETLTTAAAKMGISKAWASRLHAKSLQRVSLAMRRLRVS